jgi:HEAT repeat protein
MKRNKALQCTAFLGWLALLLAGCNESYRTDRSRAAGTDALRQKALQIVTAGLQDEDPAVRPKAIEVIAATRQPDLMPEVVKLLGDSTPAVRFAAATAVGETRYRPAKTKIAAMLEDPNANVRIAAAFAAGRLGRSGGFRALQKAITTKDQIARANAAMLLGRSGDKAGLKPLHWALKDGDSSDQVRFQTVEAIAALGDAEIYPKIWTMLISAYADDRIMGVRAMGGLGTPEARNSLVTMLDDDVLEVRLAASEQLGNLGNTAPEKLVRGILAGEGTGSFERERVERLQVMAVLAAGAVCTPPVTDYLPRMLENSSKFVRIAAAKALLLCMNGK